MPTFTENPVISKTTTSGDAIAGRATTKVGVIGTSDTGIGLWGGSRTNTGTGGVSETGHGVHGVSKYEHGVVGDCTDGTGVGVWGSSRNGEGIHAETQSRTVAAVAGFNNNPNGTGAAIYGKKVGALGHAGFFEGNVEVTGSLRVQGQRVLVGQQSGEVVASSDGRVAVSGVTIQVRGRHITAEIALYGMNATDDEPYFDLGIAEIVSDAGVEGYAGAFAERHGVTSIRFYAAAIDCHVWGRWIINFWS